MCIPSHNVKRQTEDWSCSKTVLTLRLCQYTANGSYGSSMKGELTFTVNISLVGKKSCLIHPCPFVSYLNTEIYSHAILPVSCWLLLTILEDWQCLGLSLLPCSMVSFLQRVCFCWLWRILLRISNNTNKITCSPGVGFHLARVTLRCIPLPAWGSSLIQQAGRRAGWQFCFPPRQDAAGV